MENFIIKNTLTEDELKKRVSEIKKQRLQSQDMPWLDFRLTEETMNHLRNAIDTPTDKQPTSRPLSAPPPAASRLAGNISKSKYIKDKDDWFYKNVLKDVSEYLFFRNSEWSTYFDIAIAKKFPPPLFTLETLWVNYQKQHEFNPPHQHEGLFSFVVFMQIPTYWKEQHALPFSAASNTPCASDFQFLLGQGHGPVQPIRFPLSPKDQGRMLFFPAWLSHQVFPFYGTEESRITISGNVYMEVQRS